jgi:hypothetical protein
MESYGKHAARRAASGETGAIRRFVLESFAVTEVELHKLVRDPWELFTRAVQPALWLMIFGQVFGQLRDIPTEGMSYLAFLAPGILAQSVLFSAIFYGIIVIWERDLGILHKLLVTPATRGALVFGKGLSAAVRGAAQALIVYLLAALSNIPLRLSLQAMAGGSRLRHARFYSVFHVLTAGRLSAQDAGAIHGHRSTAHDAALLRKQRHLRTGTDARVAAYGSRVESPHVSSRCATRAHDRGRSQLLWPCPRFRDPGHGTRAADGSSGKTLSTRNQSIGSKSCFSAGVRLSMETIRRSLSCYGTAGFVKSQQSSHPVPMRSRCADVPMLRVREQ